MAKRKQSQAPRGAQSFKGKREEQSRPGGNQQDAVTVEHPESRPPLQRGQPPEKAPKVIEIPASISVRDLAGLMNLSLIDLIKHLMHEGIMANINQQLDYEIAAMVTEDLGFEVKAKTPPEPEVIEEIEEEKPKRTYTEEELKRLVSRPPVVTIMGHVDHGKTKLLDAIRETRVAEGEAGGITQHIGAYQVEKQGRKITFLDTPGHEAFTAMRARGAKVTDIAVLVVAADDGVMPQTREAIDHARAAQVPIIVAINKIDKANANPDFVKQQLSDIGLVVEDWGGDVIAVEVSALLKVGIDTLLDMILLVADLADLKALPDVAARGVVIEASLDRTMGPMATVLVQEGTLRLGDVIVIGRIFGRVRAMFDDKMQRVTQAPPSMPVAILGLPDLPQAGDAFQVVADEKSARAMVAELTAEAEPGARPAKALTLDEIYAQIQAGTTKELNLILKTDAQGSIEPIVNSIEKLGTDEVGVKILHSGTGDVTESDVMLAAASKAIIIGFHVGVTPGAARLAETEGVSIRIYEIIYDLVGDIDKALKGLLEPEYKEVSLGRARVLTTFRIPRVGTIAGAQVTDGKAARNASVRLIRDGRVLYDGRVASLKRFTEDVREVSVGLEFGIGLVGHEDFQEGDVLEFYTQERVSPAGG